ncbi:hypothetical protein [Paraburkholderia bengalensis]|uniref:hypothetical protein n=1 Tax=Paraburkholderia bengalensis TaxID=2747562 RepID=UPI003014A83E
MFDQRACFGELFVADGLGIRRRGREQIERRQFDMRGGGRVELECGTAVPAHGRAGRRGVLRDLAILLVGGFAWRVRMVVSKRGSVRRDTVTGRVRGGRRARKAHDVRRCFGRVVARRIGCLRQDGWFERCDDIGVGGLVRYDRARRLHRRVGRGGHAQQADRLRDRIPRRNGGRGRLRVEVLFNGGRYPFGRYVRCRRRRMAVLRR